jgi:hypothetical protein
MKVAVALFGEEISPRLDGCVELLVCHDDREERIDLRQANGLERLAAILKLAPDVLLCGGIRRCDYFLLVQSGIDVIPGLTGTASHRLADLRQGTLQAFPPRNLTRAGTGCRRLRRRRRGG